MVNAKKTNQLTVEFSQFLCDSSEHGGKIFGYFIGNSWFFPCLQKLIVYLRETEPLYRNQL